MELYLKYCFTEQEEKCLEKLPIGNNLLNLYFLV